VFRRMNPVGSDFSMYTASFFSRMPSDLSAQ
jgi:hypothetical protein